MKHFYLSIAAALAVAACGGGGSDTDTTTSSTQSNTVTIPELNIQAGRSVTISAKTLIRGATPKSMAWTVTPLGATSTDTLPTVSDPQCASATLVAPAATGLTGEGLCQAVLTISPTAKSGSWRLTNTATSDAGTTSGYRDFQVTALPDGGFRLIESSFPLVGYTNQAMSLSMPFTINPGAQVSDVQYQWTAATENPSVIVISGAKNSTATVTPLATGQYRFDVKVTANVNGYQQQAQGAVTAIVNRAEFTDVVDAGQPQIVNPNTVVSLVGSVLNRDNTMAYTTTWRQLDGFEGGPTRVTLNNVNSPVGSFIANIPGTYGFEFLVLRTKPNGTQVSSSARTTVVVQSAQTPSNFFNVSAGDVQVVAPNSTVTLRSAVVGQGTDTYRYQWTQIGGLGNLVLSNGNSANASFVAGSTEGTYTFAVRVTSNSTGASVTAQTQVIVRSSTTTPTTNGNLALTANAGVAQAVPLNAVVMLNGSSAVQGNTAGVTYSYRWTQNGALPVAVSLSNANNATASFVPQSAGTYTFTLTVTATSSDGTTRTATADTQVLVGGGQKTFSVSAGNAQVATVNSAVALTGQTVSQGDYSGARFAYSWSQVGTSPESVTISNMNAQTASFIPTRTGVYTFDLLVTATEGGSSTSRTSRTQVLVTAP
jgi:hypothetical protein